MLYCEILAKQLICIVYYCILQWCINLLWKFFWGRCGAKQSGELGSSSEALDGIIGFGQANSSIISQLASAGKVPRVFSHCLDGKNGGGIFAIGEVVQPKVKTTPIVPNQYVPLPISYLSLHQFFCINIFPFVYWNM